MEKNICVEISEETLQDIINMETGLLYPLDGFMCEADYRAVVDEYIMKDGQVFPIPITLDVPKDIYENTVRGEEILLTFHHQEVAKIRLESKFVVNHEDILKIFGTLEELHPGVNKEKHRSPYRIGGRTWLLDKSYLTDALKPEETKRIFEQRGYKTVAGFQTRNPIHKAHEHIQRIGLEVCDGLFINPIVGWKKSGDFTQEAVLAAYDAMIENFYPKERVFMAGLKTQMRYAGPREAVFHAIIRRNLGCTHFIIGRDHAGVGGYYGAYDAHELAKALSEKYHLGIQLLLTREPYYCTKCGQIVTDKSCAHYHSHRVEISGTIIRRYISEGAIPDETMLRKEVFDAILNCKSIFIKE